MFSSDEDNRVFPFNINEDEQQYPNGYEGLMWKTTAPGWNNGPNGNRVGHDIEIVNGRKLKTSGEKEQVDQFSVTQDEMYKNNEHGDQFAELNCENVGALYLYSSAASDVYKRQFPVLLGLRLCRTLVPE